MFNWLTIFHIPGKGDKNKESDDVYREPSKASFTDPDYTKKIDTIIDSLKMPVSNQVPDFTILQPSIMLTTDKWKRQAYKKALLDFMDCYRNGWFSVCIIHNMEDAFGVCRSDSARLNSIYETLSLVHCVSWKNMDIEIIDELPLLLNEAFRLIEQLAYPKMHNSFDAEYTQHYEDSNIYYIEGDALKQHEG